MGTQHSNPGPNGASPPDHDHDGDENPPVGIDHPTTAVTNGGEDDPEAGVFVVRTSGGAVWLVNATDSTDAEDVVQGKYSPGNRPHDVLCLGTLAETLERLDEYDAVRIP